MAKFADLLQRRTDHWADPENLTRGLIMFNPNMPERYKRAAISILDTGGGRMGQITHETPDPIDELRSCAWNAIVSNLNPFLVDFASALEAHMLHPDMYDRLDRWSGMREIKTGLWSANFALSPMDFQTRCDPAWCAKTRDTYGYVIAKLELKTLTITEDTE